MVKKKVVERLINNDIEYQRTKLVGNFEKDKPIYWRIFGMEKLKRDISQL
jgi:hypothetical protein